MFEAILRYKTKLLLKKNKRKKFFLNWSEIKNILIFFDTRNYEEADAFVKYLTSIGKKPVVYGLRHKKELKTYSTSIYNIITFGGIADWLKSEIKDLTASLKKERYDLVIDLSLHDNALLDYIILHTNSSLRVGYKKGELQLLDIRISILPEKEEVRIPEEGEEGELPEEEKEEVHGEAEVEEKKEPEVKKTVENGPELLKELCRQIIHYLSIMSPQAGSPNNI